jgi:4,5-dihydroxyphthalate decarboxylase
VTLNLSLACGEYDRTIALQSGAVVPRGIDLNFLAMNEPAELFRRQARTAQYDVSEFSLSTHTLLKAQGDQRFVGLPVFLSRKFRHSEIFVNTKAGIREPKDLIGKRVGVMEYQQTACVWIRGLLQHEYGVGIDQVDWYFGGYNEPDPNYTERVPLSLPPSIKTVTIPPEKSLSGMLDDGEIDAAIAPSSPASFRRGSPNVARLFPDYQERDIDYFRRTSIFPIMHIVVIRKEVYEDAPWAAANLYDAFVKAKTLGIERLRHEGALFCALPWIMAHLEEVQRVMGDDPFSYGMEENLATLQTFLQYMREQGLVGESLTVEELFAPETHRTVELAKA